MGTYVPNTPAEQQAMLREAGYESFQDLFSCIPQDLLLDRMLDLPEGKSELEVSRIMEEMADRNVVFRHIFRGAGAYNHYIPAIVKSVVGKEEFLTSYTPYQAEISQGILQYIFEYQTMICELTGMDVANASHYDGATAAAEALAMCKDRKRSVMYVSEAVHPEILQVVRTYCHGSGTEVRTVPAKDGRTDAEALREALEADPKAAGVLVQQPNFFGVLEDAEGLGEIVHGAGAKYVMSVDPVAIAAIRSPGECGADIVVGDGQSLGMPLGFGGPYVGFMATGSKMMRKLPGRIVGETTDHDGNRAFVLTLQAREQHIRREKASSNICSNQSLCALTAAVYMSAMGRDGLREAARQCHAKAHYFARALADAGLKTKYDQPFYQEFVTVTPEGAPASAAVLAALAEEGILGGLPLSDTEILWCATEMNTKEEMDQAAAIVRRVVKGGGAA